MENFEIWQLMRKKDPEKEYDPFDALAKGFLNDSTIGSNGAFTGFLLISRDQKGKSHPQLYKVFDGRMTEESRRPN